MKTIILLACFTVLMGLAGCGGDNGSSSGGSSDQELSTADGADLGKYGKAYLLKDFRAYPGWSEMAGNARQETTIVNGIEVTVVRPLTDDTILYIQDNYVVTDGIFKGQNIIFDDVTDEWIAYCINVLDFDIPSYAEYEEF